MSWVNLYGRCSKKVDPIISTRPCPALFKKTLIDLLALANVTKQSIDRFFPALQLYAPFMSDMEATVAVSPALFTRITWAQRNKPSKYDKTSPIHIYQLKDIYAEYSLDWTTDPVLNPV